MLTICRGELEMDPSQQELRQSAAEIFMESLNQLEQGLQAEQSLQEGESHVPGASAAGDRSVQSESVQAMQLPQGDAGDRINVQALEEAAADIEQFMQTQKTERTVQS